MGNPNGHKRVTGLSGNEIYCLSKMNLKPGNLCVGNAVFSLGFIGGIGSQLKNLAGGEIESITSLIHNGRTAAFDRLAAEAAQSGAIGLSGVTTQIIGHGGNIEFLSIASGVHRQENVDEKLSFTTSGDGQALYCQVDAGFKPVSFVFGNVAYSIGVGGNIGGFLSSMSRGEVAEYSQVFDRTRRLALGRITDEAKRVGANGVIGIETSLAPFMGAQEMLMIGTASKHPLLEEYADNPVTSDLTNEEMWNLAHLGFLPIRLVMGVSVYSLGLVGGIGSALQSLRRGEVTTLSSLLYEAREKSLDRIQRDADKWGADEVVGVKTHVYDLGGGMVEFLAIGTAVKKIAGAATQLATLPPQAIIRDRDTYVETAGSIGVGVRASATAMQRSPMALIMMALGFAIYIAIWLFAKSHS